MPFITDDWDEEAAGICWRPKAASALLDGSSCEAVGACTGTAASAAAALVVGSFGRSGRTAEVLCTGVLDMAEWSLLLQALACKEAERTCSALLLVAVLLS